MLPLLQQRLEVGVNALVGIILIAAIVFDFAAVVIIIIVIILAFLLGFARLGCGSVRTGCRDRGPLVLVEERVPDRVPGPEAELLLFGQALEGGLLPRGGELEPLDSLVVSDLPEQPDRQS